ncbi:hypothetical protein CIB84_016361 [Bambusicola thoracicus]|uniref:Uncharacterized protein n=1 Tax=Bambusicola thoracicus TaxID=9083 RepID=A0A2P4S6Z7_BAMTH|nr:hypothetical protein CIB84_016361 [Bambusicola thoracicus]
MRAIGRGVGTTALLLVLPWLCLTAPRTW